jgi:hypothetical protein
MPNDPADPGIPQDFNPDGDEVKEESERPSKPVFISLNGKKKRKERKKEKKKT